MKNFLKSLLILLLVINTNVKLNAGLSEAEKSTLEDYAKKANSLSAEQRYFFRTLVDFLFSISDTKKLRNFLIQLKKYELVDKWKDKTTAQRKEIDEVTALIPNSAYFDSLKEIAEYLQNNVRY